MANVSRIDSTQEWIFIYIFIASSHNTNSLVLDLHTQSFDTGLRINTETVLLQVYVPSRPRDSMLPGGSIKSRCNS